MLASVEHFIKPADVGVSFGVFMSLVTGRFKTGGPLYFQAEGEGEMRNSENYFITKLLTLEI